MKYLLPLFILLLTFSSYGANWFFTGEFSVGRFTENNHFVVCDVTVSPTVINIPY